MNYEQRTRQLLLEHYKPLPATVPEDCPDIHPDDFPLFDAHAIPPFFVEIAEMWRERLEDGGNDAVLQLAELLWDLAWKAAE